MIYKTMNDLAPEYLQSLFSQRHSAYNLRNSEGRLTLSKPSTNYLKRSFSYSGAMLWNNLPKNLKNAASVEHVPVMTAEILICILIRSQHQRRTNQSLAVHPSPFSQKLVIRESVNDSTKNQILNNTTSTMVMCTTLQTFYPFN